MFRLGHVAAAFWPAYMFHRGAVIGALADMASASH